MPMSEAISDTSTQQKDFFVSYNRADRRWAEWIAWQLEAAGYSVLIQAWDFRPGGNFVLDMDQASNARQTIAVLSPAYLSSHFTKSEWAAAFAKDPESLQRKLIPVRVQACQREGILAQIVYVDLVGLSKLEAKQKLLAALKDRDKPDECPIFPEELQELIEILGVVDFTQVSQAYRRCLPTARLRSDTDTLETLILRLADIPGAPDEAKPLFRCVELLAQNPGIETYQKQQLLEWLQGQGYDCLISNENRLQTEFTGCQSYLMLKVKPLPRESYIVSVALVRDPNCWEPDVEIVVDSIEIADSSPAISESTEAFLQRILSEAVATCGERHEIPVSNLVVLWFLPFELLSLPVEHWGIPFGKKKWCSGKRVEAVLVRSFDRQFDPHYRALNGECKMYWQRLLKARHSPCQQVLKYLDAVADQIDNNWICSATVGCRFVEASNSSMQEDIWDSILSLGIPIALWLRHLEQEVSCADQLLKAISKEAIAELPKALTTHRKTVLPSKAEEPIEDPTGVAHLSLLWDNPFRPFPTIAYQST